MSYGDVCEYTVYCFPALNVKYNMVAINIFFDITNLMFKCTCECILC